MNKIVRQVGEGDDTRNVVRWYGYSAKKDTVEPAEHKPRHFPDRY